MQFSRAARGNDTFGLEGSALAEIEPLIEDRVSVNTARFLEDDISCGVVPNFLAVGHSSGKTQVEVA